MSNHSFLAFLIMLSRSKFLLLRITSASCFPSYTAWRSVIALNKMPILCPLFRSTFFLLLILRYDISVQGSYVVFSAESLGITNTPTTSFILSTILEIALKHFLNVP